MPQDYIVSVPLEELKRTLSQAVKEEIKLCLADLHPVRSDSEYITRKEAAKILGISLPTLSKWTRQNLIMAYRIASRIRYKRQEVVESVNKIKISIK